MPPLPLDVADRYVALGWPVIPLCPPDHAGMWPGHLEGCRSPGKAPVVSGWSRRGVPTQEELDDWRERLPTANLGLVLGEWVGIDVDGEGGERLLLEWSAGDLPETWEFRTARGRRLLYRVPPGIVLRRAGQGTKLDHDELLLLGAGQQTVIPPSVYPGGAVSSWVRERDPWHIEAALTPAWVLSRMPRVPAGGAGAEQASPSHQNGHNPDVALIDEILSRALAKSETEGRNNTGFWLAAQLRDNGLSEGGAEVVMRRYQEAAPPKGHAYTREEAQHSVRQAYAQPARAPWLRASQLRVRLPGEGEREEDKGELPSIAPLRVLRTQPPIYTATVEGRDLELSLDELIKWSIFKRRCVERLDFIPRLPRRVSAEGKAYPPQTVWEMVVAAALEGLIEEDAPPEDALPDGAVWAAVRAYLSGEVLGETREELANGRVFLEEGEVGFASTYLFRSEQMLKYLTANGNNLLPLNRLWRVLHDHGCRHRRVWAGKVQVRCWALPLSALTDDDDEL